MLRKTIAIISLIALTFTLGVYASNHQWLIAKIADDALAAAKLLTTDPWQAFASSSDKRVSIHTHKNDTDSLFKMVHFTSAKTQAVSIINKEGKTIYQWPIDWFSLWPNPTHLSYFRQPKSQPGALIHGAEIVNDGSLVFNFEYLGMLKLDSCGKVLWRLPQQTHHSIHVDENGHIWAPANEIRKGSSLKQELHEPYYVEPFILQISNTGDVLQKVSVFDLLTNNQLSGALYLSSIENNAPTVRGDTLHVNDVEVFPKHFKEGFFKHGDIMISLRNINAILIFDQTHWKLKHSIFNLTTRQHDPDFLDGNSISVYDNNNQFNAESNAFSRFLKIDIPSNLTHELFTGSKEKPFFSSILGKHQALANGHFLLTESKNGRAIEINDKQDIVWELNNLITQNESAIIQEVEKLNDSMNLAFFERLKQQCQQ